MSKYQALIDALNGDNSLFSNVRNGDVRALLADLERAEKALEKIAAIGGEWGPFPETKPEWAAMAIVTARETLDALAQMAGG